MSKPSQGQVLNVISILMNNADWDEVSSARLQKIIDNPRKAGSQFTLFLENGGHVMIGEPKILSIDYISAFDPVAFIGPGWSIVEQDARSLSRAELDLTKIIFETMLKDGERSIAGEEKMRRLVKAGYIRLDAKVLQTLWENKHLIPEAWKEPVDGNTTCIFFDGTILQYANGDYGVLCLFWEDGEWRWGNRWLTYEWDADSPSAVLLVD